jgi:3'-phosphoadenosine 5'-phosphosulfate (PAPS) 3'-phosphatase
MLDLIDGTKGFLCGGQCIVWLVLLVTAHIELSIIGCPNLPPMLPPSPQNTIISVESTNDDDAQIQD